MNQLYSYSHAICINKRLGHMKLATWKPFGRQAATTTIDRCRTSNDSQEDDPRLKTLALTVSHNLYSSWGAQSRGDHVMLFTQLLDAAVVVAAQQPH
eukprot:scaffold408_cov71-Cylindrotheca_fusiformis.AAC.19